MFEFMKLPESHAIAMLTKDHDKVKDLFDAFEKTEDRAEKQQIVAEAINELKVHAVLEEEIFYPAVRPRVGDKLIDEAQEEHHIAKILMAELEKGGYGYERRDAKFKVLAESVRHHIKEEERDILSEARETDLDFEALGEKMRARKAVLLADGIPPDAEHALVARTDGKGASSTRAAARKKAPAARKTKAKTRREHATR